MGRKLSGKVLNKKGLKGALARHAVLEKNLVKLAKVADAQKEQKLLKEKSMKAGGRKSNRQVVQQQNQKGLIPFEYDDKVVLVGEGDFSYAVSIVAQGLINPENLIATSYDSKDELNVKYPNVEENLQQLEEEGVQVLHEVDAKTLDVDLKLVSPTKRSKVLKTSLFKDRGNLNYIIFNFPHTGKGVKDMERNIIDHQKLVLLYFKSCKDVFNIVNSQVRDNFGGYSTDTTPVHSKVVLTVFEGEPYVSWGIKSLARTVEYRVERSGRFDWSSYPEYHHRRTNSTRDTTKPAAERDARVYIFEKAAERVEKKKKKKDEDSDEE